MPPKAGADRTSRDTITGEEAPSDPENRLYLLVVGDGVLATHPVPQVGHLTIGRGTSADIQIDHPSISRHHARLHLGPPLELEDLGSANGIRIGDRRMKSEQRIEVRPNEPVQLGSVTVIVQRRAAQPRRNRIRTHDYFENRMFDECARAARNNSDFGILHVVSDALDVHQLLEDTVRDSDVLAEYGPGEFEILLVDTGVDDADHVVRRLKAALALRSMQANVGTAWFPHDGRDPSTLAALARNRATGATHRETVEGGVVLADDRMRTLHELVARVAAADISVLLLGETGVGKEVIAEMIHQRSSRATKPFVRLNCSALTETLLESELFGHERGAFTGATQQKPGLLEIAEGGVVFLDEIGEMQPSTQVKLLRVLDERKVMRVGGVKLLPIDVRVVSATNRDLEMEVARGAFRHDLLYRINAMTIVIPPLRERLSEIEPLARHFIQTMSARMSRRPPQLSPAAIEVLLSYSWPGNVRELRNAIERALVFCGDEITVSDLPWEKMSAFTPRPTPAASTRLMTAPIGDDDAERRRIVTTLEECAGNQTHAARVLGISRRTLIARIEKYDVPRPRKRNPTGP